MKLDFLKPVMALMLCLVFAFSAQAQRGKMTPEKFDQHIQKLTERLELNKKQVRKVTKIEEEYFAQLDAVRSEYRQMRPQRAKPAKGGAAKTDDVREKPARSNNPQQAEQREQRRQKMTMLNNKHNNDLKAVLTPEQFEKYSAAKAERNERMRNKVRNAKGKRPQTGKEGKMKTKQKAKVSTKESKSELKVNEGLKKNF